jgi:phosphatidylserine/phosphatidylglycerophosphate/cardiolipin synthase-like enzyme
LRETICRAKEMILVIGWDIGDDAPLPGEESQSDSPGFLTLLSSCVERQPSLNVYLLSWDYAVIYVMERKLFPSLNWNVHPRIHFKEDSRHPPMGSHHQKIVVIDDSIAFVGGFDITPGRWDTRKHLPHDPRRLNSKGEVHNPIHDVQVAVDGKAAELLGSLARTRWAGVTGSPIPGCTTYNNVWPDRKPDLENVDIAISRTVPILENGKEIREVEQLYVDSIRAARKWIYIENQYFTSDRITRALARRLREANGPEILMVLHGHYDGPMERSTMGLLRKKVLSRLRRKDVYRRLHVFSPFHRDVPINIHSKLMIVDDEFVRIGSSNLSNRSMGYDTECDVAFEANENQQHAQAIARFRNGLLAEHLGASVEEVKYRMETTGSLLRTVKELRNRQKTLHPIQEQIPVWMEKLIPPSPFFDADRAVPLHRRFLKWFSKPEVFLTAVGLFLLASGVQRLFSRKKSKRSLFRRIHRSLF